MGLDKLRVSCMSLCRIEHEGQYLFVINAARARKGIYHATPLSGGITCTDTSILARIRAEMENPHGRELRFYIGNENENENENHSTETHLSVFRSWFGRRTARELTPFRELHEELVDEQRVLPSLAPEDVEITFVQNLEERQYSDRPTARVSETHYFREIFDVKITNIALMRRLLASHRKHGIFWLTLEEAQSGKAMIWENKQVRVKLSYLLRDRASLAHDLSLTGV